MNYIQGRSITIAAYRPKPGRDADLLQLAKAHVPKLREWGLATDRIAIAGLATDGTLVEVFEWETGGIEKAHTHPGVLEMWAQYAEVCDYVPLNTLEETAQMFAGFRPVEF